LIADEEKSKAQLQIVQSFLGMSIIPDEHYDRLPGSCHWVEQRDDFRNWMESTHELDKEMLHNPSVYWIQAKPGAGKSVLASYVASQLKDIGLQLALYHFHFGSKQSQSLAAFMRSIAYQMAVTNSAVRDILVNLHSSGSTFDQDDARAIWSCLFKAGIFQVCH
jgi:hypothetical protein